METVLKHNFTMPVSVEIKVIKATISKDICQSILDFAESYREQHVVDNLYKVDRTDWQLHEKEGFSELLKPVIDTIAGCSKDIVYPTYIDSRPPLHTCRMNFYDTWVAWFNGESATLPHIHKPIFNHFGYSLYLRLPNGKSSLGFSQCDDRKLVDVYEGDMLIFPGYLPHWSFDMSDGRALLAGNFEVTDIQEGIVNASD